MNPDKITKYGLLEVCDFIPGTRTKATDGPHFIYGAGMKPKGTTDKFNCESDTIREGDILINFKDFIKSEDFEFEIIGNIYENKDILEVEK